MYLSDLSAVVVSNQIKSNLFATKKEHNATQKNKANMSTGHRQYETTLTSALQNKNTTTGI